MPHQCCKFIMSCLSCSLSVACIFVLDPVLGLSSIIQRHSLSQLQNRTCVYRFGGADCLH